MSTWNEYSTPDPSLTFSKDFFESLTLEDAATLPSFPTISPPNSVTNWIWSSDIPVSLSANAVAHDEVLPSASDLAPMFSSMQESFQKGKRSIVLSFRHAGDDYQYCWSFSKFQLIKLVHTYNGPIRNVKALLLHLRTMGVNRELYDDFASSGFLDPLMGFHSTSCKLYLLASLLGETWVEEDVFNAACELEYFRQHARIVQDDSEAARLPPSDIIIPTDFLRDIKVADAFGRNINEFPSCKLLRARLSSTVISTVQAGHLG